MGLSETYKSSCWDHIQRMLYLVSRQESAVDHLITVFTWCCQCQGSLDCPPGERKRSWKRQWVMMARYWGNILKIGIHRCMYSVRFFRNLKLLYLCHNIKWFVLGIIWDIQIFCYTSTNIDGNPQLYVYFLLGAREGILHIYIRCFLSPRLLVFMSKYFTYLPGCIHYELIFCINAFYILLVTYFLCLCKYRP